ncbi:MAG: WD40/YVTN/BNR-like repeat-containing protein [Candidatus Binatia bacterium]
MASLLFVGTDAGILTLRSADDHYWQIESQELEDWSVTDLAAIPSAPNRLFAATRGDGIWFTEDFGKSWKKPSCGKRGPGKVRCIELDPYDNNIVYAGTEPIDLFVSRDAALTWERLEGVRDVPWVATVGYPAARVEPHVRDIAVDPQDPATIYIALQVGYILKTTDGGKHWQLLDQDLDADVHTIVIHPHNSAELFIATGGSDCRKGRVKGRALYKSNDAGESWEPMAMEFTQEYSVPMAVHPKNPRILFSALANGNRSKWEKSGGAASLMIRSTDGGKKWETVEKGLDEVKKNFAQEIIFDEGNPDNLYAALKNGQLYASHDTGDSWENSGIRVPEDVYRMKIVHVS